MVGSKINSNLWKVRLLAVHSEACKFLQFTYVIFMIQRRSGTCSFDVGCQVQSHLRCIFMNLS